MGEVYRARDLRLGREVAIKVLPSEVASSPDRLARFEREARAVAALNHPNIVTLHSVEDAAGVRFLTMELVEGQSLSTLVTPGGLPLPRILELAIPLTDALVAAHERGVVHRDLKPGNVMVTGDGRLKVLDFGLAKLPREALQYEGHASAATVEAPVSGEGQVLGTVPYMSPEQIRGETADARTDLFALGVILHELATGRRPFTGGTSADVTSAILRDTPDPLGRVRPDLPGDLERIVTRCLEKSPRERAQTALDVANELRRLRRALERGSPDRPVSEKVASIAVLPFVNRSRDEEDEYFSDSLADELLNLLAKIAGLRVAARSSAFQFRGTKDDIATIGRKLNVATLLEGSVRKSGNRVRISVQLVKASDGYHLWTDTYDRTLEDVFAVQDDIARSVVKELRTTLLGEEADSAVSGQVYADVARATKGRGQIPEAQRLYLLARHFLARITREDTSKGTAHLEAALEMDPTFALAWAELGGAYARAASQGWAPIEEGFERARSATERALLLEQNMPEGYGQLSFIQMVHDWDWSGAERSIRRALELAPGNPMVLRRAGTLAWWQGRLEEAVSLNRQAMDRDPLSAPGFTNLGLVCHAAGLLAEAEEALRKALELTPGLSSNRSVLALVLLDEGRGDEALSEAMREPEEAFRLWSLAILHHALGSPVESDEALRDLTEKYAEDSAFQIAEVHGARGEVDLAFEWLERAYAERDSGLPLLRSAARLRSLHGDPRWGALLRRMGFAA